MTDHTEVWELAGDIEPASLPPRGNFAKLIEIALVSAAFLGAVLLVTL